MYPCARIFDYVATSSGCSFTKSDISGTKVNKFSIQCVTFMYVRLIQIACIYIVIKRVENSNSPGGLVQAKGYSSPGISTRLGRGGER